MHLFHAYLDAGSASMLVQLLLGGFAAVAVAAKLYWRRLMTFLRIHKPDGRTVTIQARHSLTAEHIEWFRAGSALNAIT